MICVVVVGLGNMGFFYVLVLYCYLGVEIVGLVNCFVVDFFVELVGYLRFVSFDEGLVFKLDLVVVVIYLDSYVDFVCVVMDVGVYVFVEKLLVIMVVDVEWVVVKVVEMGCKFVVGYILCYYFFWVWLIVEVCIFGGLFVFCLNFNQQFFGVEWDIYKVFMQIISLIVDCGVYYVDVMCQIIDVKLMRVYGMGLRLLDEIVLDMYNYGQF